MGKYIRHGLAALVALLAGATVSFAKVSLGWEIDPEAVEGFTDSLILLLEPGVMLLVYAWSEKFMKRFPSIDLEGYVDRMWLKKEASTSEPRRL